MTQKSDDLPYREFYKEYSKKALFFLYAMIFACNLLINIDHGSIPAATLNLKHDLLIDNV